MDKLSIGILGSTGSIGQSTLEVIKNLKRNNIQVEVKFLTTFGNIERIRTQVLEFLPEYVHISDKEKFNEFLGFKLPYKLKVLTGQDELLKLVSEVEYDKLIVAVVGFNALTPTIEAIKSGKKIGLANKETLVVAGKIINELIKNHKTEIIPIDSEHSAIFQCIIGEDRNKISKIILTASGGPFRNKTIDEIKDATIKDALAHPNWNMGNKITIDSATMMNKGLEVIEAKWIFNLKLEQIEVLIHPQSIIHSLVEFIDGSVKAQLGIPNMKIPIQYAITYPERIASDFPRINFLENNVLTFEKPDREKFECLELAYHSIREGGTYPVVLNAANEVAVEMFLNKKIKFLDISKLIKIALENHKPIMNYEIEHIYEVDKKTREFIFNLF
ncbi:MAG: 1-deoxy-D-xylulose-5-phosphate reductoisomerase [Ignavibacteria bacterium]|nr:1-deoxy-D-xylulose-5-phosphate reductoisomerase [Ignavibacteria bacterium]